MAEYETVRDAAGNPVVVERRRSGGGGMGWLVVLVIIAALVWAAFHFGLIGSSGGSLPTVAVTGGEAPKITTGSIDVGTKKTTVDTPTVTVNKAPDAKN